MSCLTRILRLNHVIKDIVVGLPRCLNTQTLNTKISRVSVAENPWIYQENNRIIGPPIVNNTRKIIDLPNGLQWVLPVTLPTTVNNDKIIEAPTNSNLDVPKQAARLIVIRRKKMKKHKLKKLRKRMKFEWAKRRQRRELRKEKAFQAVLIQQCKEAEAFSAEQYLEERLQKLKDVSMPRQLNTVSRTT